MKEIISKNLTKLIEKSGKSQAQIADDLGVKKTRFNHWCTAVNLPSITQIMALAEYFNVSIYDLIYDREMPLDDRFKPYMNDDTLRLLVHYTNAEEWQRKAVNRILEG